MSENNKAILEQGNAAIAEGDFVTALGDITLKDEDGKATHFRTAMSGVFAAVKSSN
jgi:calcineurin-like phosphoesterase family protein